MAVITSQVFSQQMTENALKQSSQQADDSSSPVATPEAADINVQPSALTEIQAIQEALQEEDFDFTQLDAPAAGNQSASPSNAVSEKTLSSPVLLEDDGLLLEFRSADIFNDNLENNQGIVSRLSENDSSNQNTFDELNSADELNKAPELNATNQINAFVSEDFVTRTQGSFDTELAIPAQTIDTQYGTFISSQDGTWSYQLNNAATDIQSLAAGQTLNDAIIFTADNGDSVALNITIQGNNDQAIITGQKSASIQAETLADLNELPSISGKLNISDIDNGEASFSANVNLSGNFGTAEINTLGEWRYTLNNHSDAVQGLRSGEKLYDLFSVKTLDGSKQLIQVTIQGADDQPLLGGNNLGVLDLESQISSVGSLTISDPDFGESLFQAESGIQSALGYGTGSINAQGEWQFKLDFDFAQANPITEGQTRVDSFDVVTADGTQQTINIPILGSNQPLYAETNNLDALRFEELILDQDNPDHPLHELAAEDHNLSPAASSILTEQNVESILSTSHSSETSLQLAQSHINDIGLI